ncbi:prolyl oligopeptidase family serine peptidase [Formosa sp. PL04]|uniref:prolyl oligopeptidase family serine peptidase n=1 Tax=Formosa sp. PL04 TaxID=3081755 RepID=UPI002980BC20|nr:prolyl oligopeptidase family serine peptidase [Formosa sp. PL04]MDW5289256.1 prolyl oligopeptidase family serine peptidase [Formosa sp. PL04]
MYKFYFFILLFLFVSTVINAQKNHEYEGSPKDTTTNVYFNTTVKDPYQWMENPNDYRLQLWIESQEKLTNKIKNKYLKTLDLKAQISAMYYGVRENEVDGYIEKDKALKSKYEFEYKLQSTSRFPDLNYREGDKGNYKTLVDIKKISNAKDNNVVITGYNVNEDYDLIAVTISYNGSDWQEILFFDLKNRQQFHNSLKYIRGDDVVWDEMNLYYERYDAPKPGRELLDHATGKKLYYHKLGSAQEEDVLLFQNNDVSDDGFNFFELDDKLFFYSAFTHKDELYKSLMVADKDSTILHPKKFLVYPNSKTINVRIEEAFGDKILLSTTWGAPNGRVLLVNLNAPNKPIEIVPEYDVVLRHVNRLGKDKFVCVYRNGNSDLALFFDLEGNLLKKIEFPEGKKVNDLYENDEDATHTDFKVSSFYHPDLTYQLDLKDLSFKPSASISVPYKPESLETRYVKYKSKDGTEIPMYITCLKSTKLNGKNPTLLYAYGGYGMTVEPAFDESKALWLLHGGVLAIPNVRGGGAEGSDWGLEGRRLKKQNAIDDFIAAGEYLISEHYTSSEHLGSNGGSHGGLLVSAAAIQRPDLFKVVVAEAGAYDMLRFEQFTVGSAATNINEFGTVLDIDDFNNLKSYSPMHNIKEGVKYPNFLLMTGESDDRVPPLHTYKFLATLQEKASPESLYLMYVVPGAGHGGPLNVNDWFDKMLYKFAFLYEFLN